jgi:hypothetical protein
MEGYKDGYAAWELDDTGAETATLWILTSWMSVEAEQRCEKELCTAEGLNLKDVYLEKMMEKADDGVKTHHVAWEMLTEDMMEYWKDSDNPVWPYRPLKQRDAITGR